MEGPRRYDPAKRFGRTPENRTVNFDGDRAGGCPRPGPGHPRRLPSALPRVRGRHRRPFRRRPRDGNPRLPGRDPAPPSVGCSLPTSAQVIGNVEIGEESSVWYNTVLRGDVNTIRIGGPDQHPGPDHDPRREGHATPRGIGDDVTVGHHVVIHGCTIGNRVLVGIGAIVLDGVVIEDDCFIAAGTLLIPGRASPRARW